MLETIIGEETVMEEPVRPVFYSGDDEESRKAKRMLDESGIEYLLWDTTRFEIGFGKPPFVTFARGLYEGIRGIEGFVNIYPDIIAAVSSIYGDPTI